MFPKSCGIDDTLVASELLFSDYPNLYNLIKAKYPYILVVGFEDIIATADNILNKLKEIGIVVQVVKHHN